VNEPVVGINLVHFLVEILVPHRVYRHDIEMRKRALADKKCRALHRIPECDLRLQIVDERIHLCHRKRGVLVLLP
jgi:hypothetical protein